ncbi:MAG: hypothetical protein ACYC2P_10850 [Paludibacteraceae bacterium]
MASKRKLKKIMQFISSELITDVFFKTLMSGKGDTKKADALVVDISQFTREHINRIGRNGGKDNPKEVKEYYRKLYADWNKGIEKFIGRIEKL